MPQSFALSAGQASRTRRTADSVRLSQRAGQPRLAGHVASDFRGHTVGPPSGPAVARLMGQAAALPSGGSTRASTRDPTATGSGRPRHRCQQSMRSLRAMALSRRSNGSHRARIGADRTRESDMHRSRVRVAHSTLRHESPGVRTEGWEALHDLVSLNEAWHVDPLCQPEVRHSPPDIH